MDKVVVEIEKAASPEIASETWQRRGFVYFQECREVGLECEWHDGFEA